MPRPLELHPDRLLPADTGIRAIARELYSYVEQAPIVSPHGHTDPAWFAQTSPATPPNCCCGPTITCSACSIRRAWRWRIWALARPRRPMIRARRGAFWRRTGILSRHAFAHVADWVFSEVFGMGEMLDAETADFYFDTITDQLATDAFRPRALFDRYNIEVIAPRPKARSTPGTPRRDHGGKRAGRGGRVVTAYRPDPVVDPEFEGFRDNLKRFSEITGEDCLTGRAILPRTASAAPFSRSMAPPAPTTATPPRRPPICPRRGRGPVRPCSGSSPGGGERSAPRC
jgi:glucuronate isomerase